MRLTTRPTNEPASPDVGKWRPMLARGGAVWIEHERNCARWMHRASAHAWALWLFRAVSWLGDGPIWIGVAMGIVLWGGVHSSACLLRLAGMGLINLAIYRVLKRSTSRSRPFKACPGIRVCAPALDEYSFPSGHILHAVAFGIVLCAYYPGLRWPLAVYTVLVALSRVILGLHYPSDVVAGALLGALTAWGTLNTL